MSVMSCWFFSSRMPQSRRTYQFVRLSIHFRGFSYGNLTHAGPSIQGSQSRLFPGSILWTSSDGRRANGTQKWKKVFNYRCSTMTDKPNMICPVLDVLTYLKSTLDTVEGPSHRWLNLGNNKKGTWDKDGIFMVAVNVFVQNDIVHKNECSLLIQKLKFIQQRFPNLKVFGIQHSLSSTSPQNAAKVNMTILKEFIAFPVLLSSKDFSKDISGAFYLLFEGFKNPIAYGRNDSKIGTMLPAIDAYERRYFRENGAQQSMVDSSVELGLAENPSKPVKEPLVCDIWKELLLSFPGSVSADEYGQRIFISDTNHHRIIVANANGRVLDCIGSSPGFEDGPFETAKICCPASSFFSADQDCLYFADSENHAIRKADMENRTVQTLYPASHVNQGHGIWEFIDRLMKRLHLKKLDGNDSEGEQISGLRFPWHLEITGENDLVIANHGFGDLWILNLETGEIKESFEGMHTVVELFRQKADNKMLIIDDVIKLLRSKQTSQLGFLQDFSAQDFVSCIAKLQHIVVLVDTDSQRILKIHLETGDISSFQFLDLGCLGLPYWWSCDVEKLIRHRNVTDKNFNKEGLRSSFQQFSVQPGKCEIGVNLILPRGTKLAAPLDKGCIWQQSRGSVVELSMYDGMLIADNIGMAQQFYDELDNVISIKEEVDDLEHTDQYDQGLGTYIHSSVDVCRGVGEIIIDAVVYLTLDESNGATGDYRSHDINIVNILQNDEQTTNETRTLFSLICKEQQHLVFMKHAHVKIRMKCSDDAPKETNFLVNVEL